MMSKRLLITVAESTKVITIDDSVDVNGLKEVIIIRFDLARSSDFILQYFDEDWQSYIDVEDIGCLVDKTKLRVTSVAAVNVKSVASPESVEDQDVLSKQSSTVSNVAQWPIQFVFPVQKVPANLVAALDKGIDLCNPKHRYLRGQLLQVLCSEAVNLTSHPDHPQKIEMAKSIITAWPHLKEPIGRGYDGWLASIVDCLKSTRRVLGLIDKSRSVAILKRKRALSSGPNVSTEQKDSGQDDSEATSVSSCTEDLPSSKSARIIPRYSKKSTEVLQSSQQQHSVENTDVEAENCTNHSEDIGVFQVFGSQITTVAVIECTPSTCNDEQMSESTSTPLTPVESVSTAVYSGKVQSALQSEHSESEDNSTGNVEEVCTLQDPQALMKDLWSKPEHERPWEKLLHLLKLTFDSRRMLLLRSSTTAHIHNEYPALFSREAIIQEYCLVAETSVCMTKAVENITQKCQMLVKLSAQKLQSDAGIAGRRAGVNRLSQIMSQLSLAMEHESDPDDEHQLRAVAGLLLLPLLLKDNSSYFITTLEAADSPVSFRRHAVLSPHVVVHGSPFDRRAKTFICIDGKAMLSAKSVPDAVCLLYATYYALWLEFPKAAVCCYKYLESEIFEQKAGKLPPKLIRLLASCSSNLV